MCSPSTATNVISSFLIRFLVDHLLALLFLRNQERQQEVISIEGDLELGAHDGLDLLDVALTGGLVVLVLPCRDKVVVRPRGVLLALGLELRGLAADERYAFVQLAQTFVAQRVGLGEVWCHDAEWRGEVWCPWLHELGVQVVRQRDRFLAVWVRRVGLDAIGHYRI